MPAWGNLSRTEGAKAFSMSQFRDGMQNRKKYFFHFLCEEKLNAWKNCPRKNTKKSKKFSVRKSPSRSFFPLPHFTSLLFITKIIFSGKHFSKNYRFSVCFKRVFLAITTKISVRWMPLRRFTTFSAHFGTKLLRLALVGFTMKWIRFS